MNTRMLVEPLTDCRRLVGGRVVEDDVQFRWIDPVPEQGSYTLTLPNEKSMSFR